MKDERRRGRWEPLSVAAVARLFAAAEFPWWIAGGHAIELAAGRPLREHGDLDVLILRRDHEAVRRLLTNWDCWAAETNGRFREWQPGEILPRSVRDIWCRERSSVPWRMQLLVDESDGAYWQSRRNAGVNRPIAELGLLDGGKIPYLAPEIQLYYKGKEPRPKDEIDFNAALPLMSSGQRAWLKTALLKTYGEAHPWLMRLEK